MAEGKKTTFDASLVERLAAGLQVLRGQIPSFFAPVAAPPPVAQSSGGRRYDYSMGSNLQSKPRANENGATVDFETLRNFADSYDLLRLVIETRKDQLCKMKWNIVARDSKKKVEDDDPRVQKIRTFFMFPDGRLDWDTWLRQLVEDMLVIDAATIYPRMTKGGELFTLDVVDGATIKLLIDADGRTPVAPEPAYQQVLKGMPVANFSTDELIYRPRNVRSWKLYGYSPVEQIIMTVNIALRRQVSQLQYFTEGNIPEAWAAVPPEWTPDQIREMQEIWDSEIEGKPQLKRKVKFMPGGIGIEQTREPTIKDLFDEWLARIICFAFSISPQALVQMMNRATADTAAEQAAQEGLAPLMQWVKNLADFIIVKYLKEEDLMFEWEDGKELDPKTAAEIHKIYVDCGVLDQDEVRQDIGRDSRADKKAADPSVSPAQSGDLPASPSGEGAPAVAAADGSAALPQLGPDGQPLPAPAAGGGAKVQDAALNGTQISGLVDMISLVADKKLPAESVKALIVASFPTVNEDLINAMLDPLKNFEPEPDPVPGAVDKDGNPIAVGAPNEEAAAKPGVPGEGAESSDDEEEDAAKAPIAKAANALKAQQALLTKSVAAALDKLKSNVYTQLTHLRPDTLGKAKDKKRPSVDDLLSKLDLSTLGELATEVEVAISAVTAESAARSVRKLGKKVGDIDTSLKLANTRAEAYAAKRAAELIGKDADGGELAESTREMLRSTIVQAEEEGWSNSQLRGELEENYGFSRQRAKTIARTELKTADSQGALAGWKSSGLKMKKEWVVSSGDDECDICAGNAQEGPIDLNDSFSSGDDTAPAHPNCDCAVVPVIDEEEMQ